MKKILIMLALVVTLLCTMVATPVMAMEEYVPSYSVFKQDNMETLDIPTDDDQKARDYMYAYTNLLWVETNNVSITEQPSETLQGTKTLKWSIPRDATTDPDGWNESITGIGISPAKLAGTSGGYLLKLTFLFKLSDVSSMTVKFLEAPSGKLLQEAVVDSSYQQGESDITLVEDTVVSINKITDDAKGEYAKMEFVARASVINTCYYSFHMQSDNNDSFVLLDDIKVAKENDPVVPYYNYKPYIVDGFEQQDDTLFDTADSTNLDVSKSSIVSNSADATNEDVIMGDSSMRLYATARNVNASLTSKTLTLQPNTYKLYFKMMRTDRVPQAGINIRRVDDDKVLYNYIYNFDSGLRVDNVVNPLFDSSNRQSNAKGVYTCYGEFNIKAQEDVYIELTFKTGAPVKYMVFDDINILQKYEPAPSVTQLPPDPTPTVGMLNAQYKDLGNTSNVQATSLRMAINDTVNTSLASDTDTVIFLVVAGLLVLGIVSAIVLKLKKKGNRIFSILMVVIMSTSSLIMLASCDQPIGEVPSGYSYVAPAKIEGKLDNPGMGWVILEEPTYGGHPDLGSSGAFPEADNISLSTSWAHIEVEEGDYDFTLLDQVVDYWTSQGKHINLRICTDSLMLPYTYKGVPDWLTEKYNINHIYVDYLDPGPVRTSKVIDVGDEVYLQFLDKFLHALNEHYYDNVMVDTVEVRGFGLWGEWHHGYTFDTKQDRISSLHNVLSYYSNAFASSGKMLAVSSAWDPDFITTGEYYHGTTNATEAFLNYVKWSALDEAWRLPQMSFRRDSGGALLYYSFDERIMAEAFRSGKRIPLYGEYATNYYNLTTAGNAFDLETAIDDILYKMRANYSTVLGWVAVEFANIIEAGDTDFIDYANKTMGYRLAVDNAMYPTAVSTEQPMLVKTQWSNSAVGIFPYKTDLVYSLIDSNGATAYSYNQKDFDARTFVQGEVYNQYAKLTLPATVANGTYDLAVSIPHNGSNIELGMAGEMDNNAVYSLGKIEVKDNVKLKDSGIGQYTYDNIDSVKLDSNTTYQVTFRYQPQFDMANFYFGTSDGYVFEVNSAKDNNTVGRYQWQDISSEVGYKTVTFTTGNAKDYKMNIKSINFDEIFVDDVYIEKVNAVTESFENYDVTDLSTIIEPISMGTADVSDDKITGKSLELNSANSQGYNALAKVDTHNYTFDKGMHTVTFDMRAGTDANIENAPTSNGGYFYIALQDYSSVATTTQQRPNIVGTWYERSDNFDTKKTFSFYVGEEGQTLVFGIKNVGGYYIDNLILQHHQVSQYCQGVDKGYMHNAIPVHDVGIGKVESFERGSFQATGYEWGQFAWGRMTLDPDEVVNYSDTNKISLLGRVEKEAYNPITDNVWFEFVRTKRAYFPFEANKAYTVEFDYVVLKGFASGKVFAFFRDDTLGDKRFVEAINAPIKGSENDADLTGGKVIGKVYHFKQTFQLTDHDSFQFMICMNGLWEISIDNMLITEAVAD